MTQETEQGTAQGSEASLDDIVEQSRVRFPKPLTIPETEKLLIYIAEHLTAIINYQTSQYFSIDGASERAPMNDPVVNEPGTPSLKGTIVHSVKGRVPINSFNSEPDIDGERISSLRFDVAPEYEVRDLVDAYFQSAYKK
jgi:hypothetical protein